MASTLGSPEPLATGSHGAYKWLTTRHELDDILRLCPAVVLGKYLAITSIDSGHLSPSTEEKLAGWESRLGIAYSPLVQSVETLPRDGWPADRVLLRGGHDAHPQSRTRRVVWCLWDVGLSSS